MGVSKNRGTPKSSILIGFSIINHPFLGYPYFWKHPCIYIYVDRSVSYFQVKKWVCDASVSFIPFASLKTSSSIRYPKEPNT